MSRLFALRENLPLKAAALILAVFLWLYVRGEERPVQLISLPLELEGLPADLAIVGDRLESIAVRVRAPEATLRALSPGRFRAHVNLGGARTGEVSLPLARENVRAPIGVEVVQVDPSFLTLRFERRSRREVPLVARLKGAPAAGLEARGYTLVPDHVAIEGPESLVAAVEEVLTEEVDLSGVRKDLQQRVRLAPIGGGVRIDGAGTAALTVAIGEALVTTVYPGVRVSPNLPAGAAFEAVPVESTVTVTLEGTAAELRSIQPENLTALLDLEGMSPRGVPYDVRPRVVLTPEDLGEGVTVRAVSPETISVRLSHRRKRD